MSSRIFQGVIVQMKEATDRVIGVVDEQGFVIACSELATIGTRLEDFSAVADASEPLFTTAERTYKILSGSAARFEYAVFVAGTDSMRRALSTPSSSPARTRLRAASAFSPPSA